MLLLRRSTPSGYQKMAQGKSTIAETCRNCNALLNWVLSQNMDHTTVAEKAMEGELGENTWSISSRRVDKSVVEREAVNREDLACAENNTKQEQYQRSECTHHGCTFNDEPIPRNTLYII